MMHCHLRAGVQDRQEKGLLFASSSSPTAMLLLLLLSLDALLKQLPHMVSYPSSPVSLSHVHAALIKLWSRETRLERVLDCIHRCVRAGARAPSHGR